MIIKSMIKRTIRKNNINRIYKSYYNKFNRFAFTDCECQSIEQFEASITRLYHTIEKGLSYENYRAGFGKDNIEKLIISLEQYIEKGYSDSVFFYKTALSCLDEYIRKNREYGYEDLQLENRVNKLPGKKNECGGIISISAPQNPDTFTFQEVMTKRHSIRHFSDEPVDIDLLKKAILLAQHTPSACNRQSWKTRIIVDKDKIKTILFNQNGNRGFGQEFDKVLLLTADLRKQQKNRELFQAYIDGGMYAESILNSLYFYGIGSVPLSAALTADQEKNIREIIGIDEAEVLILFVGVGNYPKDKFMTTRSERKVIEVEVI